jgi:hypothetical protein
LPSETSGAATGILLAGREAFGIQTSVVPRWVEELHSDHEPRLVKVDINPPQTEGLALA